MEGLNACFCLESRVNTVFGLVRAPLSSMTALIFEGMVLSRPHPGRMDVLRIPFILGLFDEKIIGY